MRHRGRRGIVRRDAAALALTQAGKRVALVEPRISLDRERTTELRPWLEIAGSMLMPPLLQDLAQAAGTSLRAAGYLPLGMDGLKLRQEDLLLAAGVKLVYNSYALQVSPADGRLALVIGNKPGRQVIHCGQLVAATETARLADPPTSPASPQALAASHRRRPRLERRNPGR